MLRSIVKSVLPARFLLVLRSMQRQIVFRNAMKRFLRDPGACLQPGNLVIRSLISGWGNNAWSALDDYLAACIEYALTTNGPILECGSGLSTILVGAIAEKRGVSLWSLEHNPGWAKKSQVYLDKYDIKAVSLCVRPLRDYGSFSWYDPPMEFMPDKFSLVICDGPPGDTKGGRIGLSSVMRARLPTGCVILLDDATRLHERAIARKWNSELGTSSELRGQTDPYIKLTIESTGDGSEAQAIVADARPVMK